MLISPRLVWRRVGRSCGNNFIHFRIPGSGENVDLFFHNLILLLVLLVARYGPLGCYVHLFHDTELRLVA